MKEIEEKRVERMKVAKGREKEERREGNMERRGGRDFRRPFFIVTNLKTNEDLTLQDFIIF